MHEELVVHISGFEDFLQTARSIGGAKFCLVLYEYK